MSDDSVLFPLRFVVLRHSGVEQPHFDLLFETAPGTELEAYRIQEWPLVANAVLQPNRIHRRMYLNFQGELSEGRGTVTRAAAGRCQLSIKHGRRELTLENQTVILLPVLGV